MGWIGGRYIRPVNPGEPPAKAPPEKAPEDPGFSFDMPDFSGFKMDLPKEVGTRGSTGSGTGGFRYRKIGE